MPMIRALTLHIKSGGFRAQEVLKLLGNLRSLLEARGIPVWTLRVSLGENDDWQDAVEYCSSGVLLAAYHRRASEVKVPDLVEYLRKCPNGYATILASEEDVELLPELYAELSKILNEDYFTRIGVSYGAYIQTPYFPLSTALENAVSVAYRYIDLLLSSEPRRWADSIRSLVERVDSHLRDALGEFGLRVYHDVSISPWMTESSVDVVERLGAVFPKVGTFSSVFKINMILTDVSRGVKSTGFNELMMPVAEDNKLKELVKSGELRVEDLVALSTACVAGLDMVAVPRDFAYLRGLFADTYTAFSIKRRPYGVRIVPTDKSVVKLARFGDLPAFSYPRQASAGRDPSTAIRSVNLSTY